ncbi:MAG: ABC transporter ATP-binding protein [Cyanobacteria bacterium P01_F01_bin.150]
MPEFHDLSNPQALTQLHQEGSAQADHLLQAHQISKRFGGVLALDNVSLSVDSGSITGLIGPNGAGKTTLFTILASFTQPDTGSILFDGHSLDHLSPHQLTRYGLVRTFQVARVLSRLSVLENVLLAAQRHPGESIWQVWLRPHRVRTEENRQRKRAMDILESVGLAHMAHDYAGALSGGQRKLLELARALMVQPKLILLDEPAAGVNPTLIQQICDHIQRWNQQGISFLIIEHNMDVIMSLCDRVWVLAEGRNLANGDPQDIQTNPQVLEAYLGQ